MTKSEKIWQKFTDNFRDICVSHGGQAYPRGIIYERDGSYLIPTPFGPLRASVHWPGKTFQKVSGRYIEGIFMRFDNYTGPKTFPLGGDFNDWSHKWNITSGSNDLEHTFSLCLVELNHRLDLLKREAFHA
jgi:hypothetical protein